MHEFSSHILGVKYSFEDEICIAPETMGLTYARGTVPTRHGFVSIDWKLEGGKFSLKVEAPDGVVKNILLPDGSEHSFSDGKAEFTCGA